MPKRLPDKLFRDQGTTDSPDVLRGAEAAERSASQRRRVPFRSRDAKGFAPPLVVAGVVGALLLGFGVGKLVVVQGGGPAAPEVTVGSPTMTATVMPSADATLVPWDGPVRDVPALAAEGRCLSGTGFSPDPPSNLVDDDPGSLWRCWGSGTGETITFTLEPEVVLVGVRLINGNTVSTARYLAERRILTVKWTFSDGSWVVQPLAANDRQFQEVRFPPTTISGDVTMTVLDATVPGETSEKNDAVSISALEFLEVR
ncbi:NADase-type glycan-binding domain-containing protein [Tessaracoccus antarcticus]|nr:hypothetical protein [Tessaracoccus antarcticus]